MYDFVIISQTYETPDNFSETLETIDSTYYWTLTDNLQDDPLNPGQKCAQPSPQPVDMNGLVDNAELSASFVTEHQFIETEHCMGVPLTHDIMISPACSVNINGVQTYTP